MNTFKNVGEMIKALADGEKITQAEWENEYIHMVDNNLIGKSGREFIPLLFDYRDFGIYTPQKKTVKVAQYRFKWTDDEFIGITPMFYENVQGLSHNYCNIEWAVRLDLTEEDRDV